METIARGLEQITYGYDGDLVTSEQLTGTLSQTLSYVYSNDFAVDSLTYAGTACSPMREVSPSPGTAETDFPRR